MIIPSFKAGILSFIRMLVPSVPTEGYLYSWGLNSSGRLGLGDIVNRSSPVQVGTDTDWASVSGGGSHTHAIKTTGTP